WRSILATAAGAIGLKPLNTQRWFERRKCLVLLQRLHTLKLKCSSSMGFEDEVEQSFGRPCRQTNGRFKRTYELTSSIVPRGTSFHRAVELACSPVRLDPARLSCCCGSLPGPAELGAVNPDAMHDHGQPARQRHDCLLHPACLAIFIAQALSQDHFAERT